MLFFFDLAKIIARKCSSPETYAIVVTPSFSGGRACRWLHQSKDRTRLGQACLSVVAQLAFAASELLKRDDANADDARYIVQAAAAFPYPLADTWTNLLRTARLDFFDGVDQHLQHLISALLLAFELAASSRWSHGSSARSPKRARSPEIARAPARVCSQAKIPKK